MRFPRWQWLLLCAFAATGGPALRATADTPAALDTAGVAPPVERLVAAAMQRAPAIAAMAARAEAAEQRVSAAGALPDPILELMLQDENFPEWTVGDMPMSMIGPQLAQGIPFPGKRSARRAAAREAASVSERELEVVRREVARQVRELYARVYAMDHEAAALDGGRELLALLSATISGRQSVAESDLEAVFKTRLALSRIEERARDLSAERAMAVAALNRTLDLPAEAPLGLVTSLPRPAAPAAAWDSLAVAGSGDVAVRSAGVSAAAQQLRAAKLDLRPDFMVGAGLGFRGELDPVVNLRLGMEIPLWAGSKQKPLIRAARAELAMSQHELRDAEAAARAQAASLRADYERSEEQIVRYEESFVPQTGFAFDAARSAYLGGRGDFSTVIEDLNLWLEARAGLARRVADRFIALARLDALTAPAPESGTEGDLK